MAKKESAAPKQHVVSENDIPLLPYERKGTSEADESGLMAFAGSLLGEEPTEPTEQTVVETEPEETEIEEVEAIEAEADESIEAAEPEAVAEETEPVFEIDGEKVTLSELKKERLRQADYTRKTQELAEQRKATEAEVQQYRETRNKYAAMLEQVEAALGEPEPDWQKIREEDPDSYAQQFADFQLRKQQRDAVVKERERIAAEQAAEYEEQVRAKKAEEREKLVAVMPELTQKDEAMKLVSYAETTYGWTAKDLDSTTDHRLIVLLNKARKWDESQAKGAKVVAEVPATRVLKPGAKAPVSNPQRTAKRKEVEQKLKTLKRDGRMNNAVAAIESLLG